MTWLVTWLTLALLVFAEPFWQIKPPAEWSDIELSQFLGDSPWAQMAAQPGKALVGKNAGQGQLVQLYLATAGPVVKAVAERERRTELRRPGTAKALADDPLSGGAFRLVCRQSRGAHYCRRARRKQ